MKLSILSESLQKKRHQSVHSIEELAECLSRYSNRPEICELRFNVTNSWTALAVILISTYYRYWETEKLIRHIAQLAYSRNYEGQWKTVQELLETGLQSPEQYREKFLEHRSPEEFYGNLLPLAGRLSRTDFLRDSSEGDKRPVRRKIRHRGYRDKGTYRFSHERHGEPLPRGEHTLDLRSQVAHPLLNPDWRNEENFKLRDVPVSTSQKGGKEDGQSTLI